MIALVLGLLMLQRRMKRREKKLKVHEPSLFPLLEQEMKFNIPFACYCNTDFIVLIYTIIYTH